MQYIKLVLPFTSQTPDQGPWGVLTMLPCERTLIWFWFQADRGIAHLSCGLVLFSRWSYWRSILFPESEILKTQPSLAARPTTRPLGQSGAQISCKYLSNSSMDHDSHSRRWGSPKVASVISAKESFNFRKDRVTQGVVFLPTEGVVIWFFHTF